MGKGYLFVLLILGLAACETTVEVDVPRYPAQLTANGLFNPDSVWQVELTENRYILDTVQFASVPDAEVRVLQGGQTVAVLDYVGENRFTGSSIYRATNRRPQEMDNLLEYRDGADFLDVEEDWQDRVVVGSGRSYGAELLVEQRTGRLTGWVGYTLSWTDRQFEEVNFGERFPFRYDRRHDISVTGSYQWTKRFVASATWVFGTGQTVTLPVSSYDPIEIADFFFRDAVSEGDIEEIRGRNGFRMPPYHRLDLNIQHTKEKKWGERVWTVGVYNAYNRRNPFFISRDTFTDGTKQFVQYTLFPVLPTISYTLLFR